MDGLLVHGGDMLRITGFRRSRLFLADVEKRAFGLARKVELPRLVGVFCRPPLDICERVRTFAPGIEKL